MKTLCKTLFFFMILQLVEPLWANDEIRFTWFSNVCEKKFVYIWATKDKSFTVDWGDDSAVDTYTGKGNDIYNGRVAPSHSYSCDTSRSYQVVITGATADCFFTRIDCYLKQLTDLDVSKSTALTVLGCGGNPLKSLDVSKNTALTILNCDQNRLTRLDVSKNTALVFVSCEENFLPLSQLYPISEQIKDVERKHFGVQYQVFPWSIQLIGYTLDLSSEKGFGTPEIATIFTISKREYSSAVRNTDDTIAEESYSPALLNTDYTITDGKITFKTEGSYTVQMNNHAIKSDDYVAASGIIGIAERVHTITATAGTGGSIAPSGTIQVAKGETYVFSIIPKYGYTVKDVVVDGHSVGARKYYTFISIVADHTITASFEPESNDIDEEKTPDKKLNAYPNPINGQLSIVPCPPKITIEVYDLTGNLLATFPVTGEKTDIDITHLPSGMYLLKVGNETVKVMKQ